VHTSSPRSALQRSVRRAGVIAAAIGFTLASATGVVLASDPADPYPVIGSEPAVSATTTTTSDAVDDSVGTDGIEIHRAGS